MIRACSMTCRCSGQARRNAGCNRQPCAPAGMRFAAKRGRPDPAPLALDRLIAHMRGRAVVPSKEPVMPAQLIPAAQLAAKARTPFPGASPEYERAREALLAEEIEFRRHMTRLVEQRRALPPGPEITKNYRF